MENVGKTVNVGYHELMQYNSIATHKKADKYSTISYTIETANPKKTDIVTMAFFGVQSYREFYAIKFDGDSQKITRVSLIKSEVKDTTLPSSAKWNFTITELASETVDLPYDKKMDVKIETDEKKITLYVDGKKILKYKADERVDSGRIGFSNRHAQPRIYGVKVMNGKEVVFEDDFKEDSISRFIMKRKPAK